ncbi:Stp1/IreP family PP2C-type Ser/Thr phosphatase [Piscinibacter sakaiensis]|uniref:Stp1/IreP family PP2C-type Ser/Thr phosphatase n=1 Tax=Piscinibacter sakaiensis TaxID=1547922 RepID=UPI003AAF43C3
MEFEFFSITDTGRSRSNNEDSIAVDEKNRLVVLADGMGGYNAGEVASSMATSILVGDLGRWLSEAAASATDGEVRRAMTLCVDNVNQAIFSSANTDARHAGMGTTLVTGVFRDARLLLGHIGDSRAYRLRDGTLRQITRDHSLLQEQIDAGLITAEQAASAANKNLVTRAVGVESEVQLELHGHDVLAGDVYLFCSDGLTDMVDRPLIERLLKDGDSLQASGQALLAAANAAGGRDNISVILVRASAATSARPWWQFRR